MGILAGPSFTTSQGFVLSTVYLSVNFYRFIPNLDGTMQCVIGLSAFKSRQDKYTGVEPISIPVSLSTIDVNIPQLEFYRKSLHGVAYDIIKDRWRANGYTFNDIYETNQPSPTQFVYDCSGFNIDGFANTGFNAQGYNSLGFNSAGYNAFGYDASGYNAAGLDLNGFNAAGYNTEGYNRMGFDKDGFNKDGYDRMGYNANGMNSDGVNREGYDANGNLSSTMSTMLEMNRRMMSSALTFLQISSIQGSIRADTSYSYLMPSLSTLRGVSGDLISTFVNEDGRPFFSTLMIENEPNLSTFLDISGNPFVSTVL
jgi:hypothetical protein